MSHMLAQTDSEDGRGATETWYEYSAGSGEEDDGQLLTELELGREGEGREGDLSREGKND